MEDFGVETIVVVAGISTFVLGFAVGPLIWAPLSEVFGRRPLFIWPFVAMTAFNAGTALAPNATALIVMRFFAGAFGSSPMTNTGGSLSDMFNANQRGLAVALFAAAPFMGPVAGPIVGGFTGQTVGWRYVMWVMTAFTGVVLLAGALWFPETYAPVLLRQRAHKLSALTGQVYRSKYDAKGEVHVAQLLATSLVRPWQLLFREPIVFMLSIYIAIIYGVLYLLFAAFPIVFQRGYGWTPGIGGLAFVGVAIGMVIAVLYNIIDNGRYVRIAKAAGGMAPPEARLPPAIVGAFAIPIGLFWFAWTNTLDAWIVCELATIPFGFGLVLVFLSSLNYLIDSYLIYAASVMAASGVLRSLFGAAFPLFTKDMYANLGVHWASAIPAFLALACVPFPILFYVYGARIRATCKYSSEASAFLAKMMAASAPSAKTVGEVKVAMPAGGFKGAVDGKGEGEEVGTAKTTGLSGYSDFTEAAEASHESGLSDSAVGVAAEVEPKGSGLPGTPEEKV
ncbi:hypothetical protein HYH03_009535 [Edaphochlamys debaryana]|uniref:Major facilitator superfamily (MFS) profile domain-containing protein n=1 Tax=Edaphochlamys debaryana TaxID=47281 RepID=A0A836BX97_9CHLO|nr:hypothetical protein HYH03_009535 [Edaphochlamys debaryana]|eukprot:KAG2492295.1 hypothetical protein HYH03_009535 [Edaphochlamys debaryana]